MKIKMLKQENVQKKTLKNCNVHLVLLFFPEKVSNEVSKCMTILDQTLSHSKFHTNLSINVKTKKHQFLPYNSMGPVKKFFLNKKICSPNRSVKSPSIWPQKFWAFDYKFKSARIQNRECDGFCRQLLGCGVLDAILRLYNFLFALKKVNVWFCFSKKAFFVCRKSLKVSTFDLILLLYGVTIM